MASPKNIKQSIKTTLLRIILNPNNFIMIGSPTTHVLVARVMQVALAVPNFSIGDTWHSLKRQFDTPKTASTELGELLTGGRNVVVGALSDGGVLHGGGVGAGPEAEAELVEDVHGGLVAGGNGSGSEREMSRVGFREREREFW